MAELICAGATGHNLRAEDFPTPSRCGPLDREELFHKKRTVGTSP